jgi:hypothetical protein
MLGDYSLAVRPESVEGLLFLSPLVQGTQDQTAAAPRISSSDDQRDQRKSSVKKGVDQLRVNDEGPSAS